MKLKSITHKTLAVLVGVIVSIASSGIVTRTDKESIALLNLIETNGELIKLEGGEFKGADVFNSTGVSTVLIILNK